MFGFLFQSLIGESSIRYELAVLGGIAEAAHDELTITVCV